MSSRTSHAAVRALLALSRETAEMPLPPIDWDRIEQVVLSDIARAAEPSIDAPTPVTTLPGVSAAPVRRTGSPWMVAFAAAAAALLVVGANFGTARSPAVRMGAVSSVSSAVRGVTRGDWLEIGGVVVAESQPLTYAKAGLATFTVTPSSRIQLVAAERDGDRPGAVTIALVEGSVHAEVEPQAEGEAFAVEVDHTRVAVHGTSFTVTRQGGRVLVEVAHGSVAVGPAGHPGSTHRWLVVGPDRATFSLDGATDAKWAPALGEPSTLEPSLFASSDKIGSDRAALRLSAEARRGRKPATAAGAPISASPARPNRASTPIELPDRPIAGNEETIEKAQAPATVGAAEQEELARAAISKGLDACYERQLEDLGVSFSIETSLSLSILPSGAIREGVFNPPLSPTLMTCARDAITRARFAPGGGVRQIRLPVRLSRP